MEDVDVSPGFENCIFNWTEEEAMLECIKEEIIDDNQQLISCCNPINQILSKFAGYLCIAVALVGLCGNFMTLLAIPWAGRNHLHGFNSFSGKYTNIFIVNLAFSDFLYCLINLPLYSLQYLQMAWPLGHEACRMAAAVRYINAFAAWMAVGFVALSRCLSMTNRKLCKQLLDGARGYTVILMIWFYSCVMVLPSSLGVYGQFGYNRKVGKCDFMLKDGTDPHMFFYAVGFILPLLILLVSYFLLWRFSIRSTSYLKSLMYQNRQQFGNREHRMTIMILLVCGCYVLFVGPIALVNIIDIETKIPELHLICFLVYWLQYSFNFFIYAFRNEQYKKAYILFFRRVMKKICCNCQDTAHTSIFVINANMLPDMRRNRYGNVYNDMIEEPRVDLRLNYSVDVEVHNSIISRAGTIEVEGGVSPAIIILPGKLSEISATEIHRFPTQNLERNLFTMKTRKMKNPKKKVDFYSEGDFTEEDWTEERKLHYVHSCPSLVD